MKKLVMIVFSVLLTVAAAAGARQEHRVIVRHGTAGGKNIEAQDGDLPGMPEGDLFHIPEISAMISGAGGTMKVDHVLDPEMRPKGYEKTEVKEGDVILMVNGKRPDGLSGLKELYANAPVGSTMKIGIKRNDEMLIASFTKADPKDMPKMRIMISHGDGGDFLGIPQIGLRFTSKDGDVIVKEVLPNAGKALPDAHVKEGDIITKMNGLTITSFKRFESAYEKIPVGDRVELVAGRAGTSQTITFLKPKDDGRVIIRR